MMEPTTAAAVVRSLAGEVEASNDGSEGGHHADGGRAGRLNAITRRAYARVGLLGNPSDGYFGKTIAFTIANFYAEATLEPRRDGSIRIEPHLVHDGVEFASLLALVSLHRCRHW